MRDAFGQGKALLFADSYPLASAVKTVRFPTSGVVLGDRLVATATDLDGNTSEFTESIEIVDDATGPIRLRIERDTQGAFIALTASPGARYELETSVDLKAWISAGVISAIEGQALTRLTLGPPAARFYRVRQLP